MKAVENIRIKGIVEGRPSASAMPPGIDATMPVTDTTSVTRRPPQSRVSTTGNPPWSRPIIAIIIPRPANVTTLVISGRQPGPGVGDAAAQSRQQADGPADAEALEPAAMQQEKSDRRKCEEKQAGVDSLGRNPRNQQRQQQDRGEDERQIDPPPLRLRVEAIDELAEFCLDERPAGADRTADIFSETCGAVLAAPDRIDQQKFDRGDQNEPQEKCTHDRDQDVGW